MRWTSLHGRSLHYCTAWWLEQVPESNHWGSGTFDDLSGKLDYWPYGNIFFNGKLLSMTNWAKLIPATLRHSQLRNRKFTRFVRMAASMDGKLEKWICVEMSKLLGIDANQDLARWLSSELFHIQCWGIMMSADIYCLILFCDIWPLSSHGLGRGYIVDCWVL